MTDLHNAATIAQCESRRTSPIEVEPLAQCACSESCGDIGDREAVLVIGRMVRQSDGTFRRWQDVILDRDECRRRYLANLPGVQFVESGIAHEVLGDPRWR
jgi:hypothetical protein